MSFLLDLLGGDLTIRIVDIGASPVEGYLLPYKRLVDLGVASVIGFEPNVVECQAFRSLNENPAIACLPYAVGDGCKATLHVFSAPGMTSLLKPNMGLMGHFVPYREWCKPVRQESLETHKLDDLDIGVVDYLKLDTQGSELAILQNAERVLKDVLIVHTEVQFIPMYHGQPLFADIDTFLRAHGFMVHCLAKVSAGQFEALYDEKRPRQITEADMVYIKDFIKWGAMPADSLRKIALILHELYSSVGLAAVALKYIDEREGTKLYDEYKKGVQ